MFDDPIDRTTRILPIRFSPKEISIMKFPEEHSRESNEHSESHHNKNNEFPDDQLMQRDLRIGPPLFKLNGRLCFYA